MVEMDFYSKSFTWEDCMYRCCENNGMQAFLSCLLSFRHRYLFASKQNKSSKLSTLRGKCNGNGVICNNTGEQFSIYDCTFK